MKLNFKLNISNRISIGYIIIIIVAVLATVYCIVTLQDNKELDRRIQSVYLPSYLNFKELNALCDEALKLTNNWIYQPNVNEKKNLVTLQDETYISLKRNTLSVIALSTDINTNDSVKAVLQLFDVTIESEKEVMSTLNADSLYSNDKAVDKAITLLDKKIAPSSLSFKKTMSYLIASQESKIRSLQEKKESSYTFLMALLIIMIVIFFVAAAAAYFYARKSIVEPIVKIKNIIIALGQGKLVNVKAEDRHDEIGEMTLAMSNFTTGINSKTKFAEQIGKGNYNEDFQLLSDEDVMGRALLEMRDNLKQNAKEEHRRRWTTQGLAEIGSILRAQTKNTGELYDNIIRFVVKYLEANQGGLFFLENNGSSYLELMACYAFERKKYLERKVEIGEGLLGQCVLEQQSIYMIDIPKNYIRITSGLGDSPPSCLFIVPLKVNEEVQGVMEIASLKEFEPYQREFIEKLGENIASTILSAKISERTTTLLQQSQQQAEEMKAQEEEMRQNMEELSATQEEMSRKEKGYLSKIAELEAASFAKSSMKTVM
ncbi:MAG TPA: GAF domain-containing protein [Cyclobacteriaceae bacterium]|jgi:nitrate/nitrite-specific signal transduction histidine kinase|nr:GAF domain-containing protein [Cyclobacteriaceae bacterium]